MSPVISFQRKSEFPIQKIYVHAYTIPTDQPESDGTYEWDHTDAIVVEVEAGDKSGLGMTYSSKGVGHLIDEKLKNVVIGQDSFHIPSLWQAMIRSVRNIGRPGMASMAISAVDMALWDLKAKLLNLPLHNLLGAERDEVPIYGSGGFTSYPPELLANQLAAWVSNGIPRVKMKVGRHPEQDEGRVRLARQAIGVETELFVDANGAYQPKQALDLAKRFSEMSVTWFEEPVSSDNLEGLRFVREHVPLGMEVAAGEYGFDSNYFLRMLDSNAVDVLQVDVTRCCGITGFLKVIGIAEAAHFPLSAHTAPSLHAPLGCHSHQIRHLEYFHDHILIENLLFDGSLKPVNGALRPDPERPGFGLVLKKKEAEKYAA